MNPLLTAIALATLAFSGTAVAADHDHDHDHADSAHVVHYEVEPPKTHDAAIAMITEKDAQVGALMQHEKLDSNQIEKVHEYTYSIEVAVTYLRDETLDEAQEAALDGVDEANQALHYAAENHEEAIAREWYAKLQPAVADLNAHFKAG